MYELIDHVGVAVEDLDAAVARYGDRLEMVVEHREVIREQGVSAVLLSVGASHVELMAPLEADSPVGRFLARRGEGLHHVAYRVDDIDGALARLRARGARLIDEVPRAGIRGSRVAFLHPAPLDGVLTELVQPVGEHR